MNRSATELAPDEQAGLRGQIFDSRAWGLTAVVIGPSVVTAYLAFNAGGFFAGAPGLAAAGLGIALVLRIMLADEPFAGFGPWLATAAGALGLYVVWTLMSGLWSDAPAQAMIEFDRVLVYWLALVLFGSMPRDTQRLSWAVRVFAATIVGIALIGLATRLLPDVWAAPATIENDRLSYPLTYWNALGILIAVGIVLCTHIASGSKESRVAKAFSAAALPILTATLYFTFSRGALAAVVLGLLVYALVVHPRGLLLAALAVVPPAALATVLCYRADILASNKYATAAGVAQGHHVAVVVLVAAAVAGLLRLWLAYVADPRLERLQIPASSRRSIVIAATLAVFAVAAVATAGFDAPGKIGNQYDRFVNSSGINDKSDLRARFTDVRNNGRLVQWRVALDAFDAEPLRGEGAGTFGRIWAKNGVAGLKVEDAHSLYVETLAELGLPGLLLLATTLLTILTGLSLGLRGPDRHLYGALMAAGIAWVVHAGIDWDWEMPATALWLFALGGLALARPATATAWIPRGITRLLLAAGCLAVLVTPVLVALSQAELDSSIVALKQGDCHRASEDALDAARFVSARPEPYQVLGFCDSQAGEHRLAIEMFRTAIDRDPKAWDSYYGLALVTAAAGLDPRPAARRALDFGPHEPLAEDAVRRFQTNNPTKWKRRASSARLPIY